MLLSLRVSSERYGYHSPNTMHINLGSKPQASASFCTLPAPILVFAPSPSTVRCTHLPAPQCRPGLIMPRSGFCPKRKIQEASWFWQKAAVESRSAFVCEASSAQMAHQGSWTLLLSHFLVPQNFLVHGCLPVLWLHIPSFPGMCPFLDLLSGTQHMCAGVTILSQLIFPVLSLTLSILELYSPVKRYAFPFSMLPSTSHLHALVVCMLAALGTPTPPFLTPLKF